MRGDKDTTRGGVIIEDLKLGDILYEFEYGMMIKSKVTKEPEWVDDGWEWESENTLTGSKIGYRVTPQYSHYGPKVYNYEAYTGCKQI